eukprot:62972-Amphidinium_carterae.1
MTLQRACLSPVWKVARHLEYNVEFMCARCAYANRLQQKANCNGVVTMSSWTEKFDLDIVFAYDTPKLVRVLDRRVCLSNS